MFTALATLKKHIASFVREGDSFCFIHEQFIEFTLGSLLEMELSYEKQHQNVEGFEVRPTNGNSRSGGLQIIPYLPRVPLESSDLTQCLGMLPGSSHSTPFTPRQNKSIGQVKHNNFSSKALNCRKAGEGPKSVRGTRNSSRGGT